VIVVDTAVLVYAIGDEHPLRAPCQRMFDAVSIGQLQATTSVEVVQEFAHVWSRRRPRRDAAAQARDYARLLDPLLVTGPDVRDAALDIYERCDRLGAFDAFLAALSVDRGAALVSADRAFATVPGLRHLDPGGPSFLADLGLAG
jgi:uncharacterized protein